MNFNELWKRAELNSIRAFLKHGGEDSCEFSDKSYHDRIYHAEKSISDFLASKYPDFLERDEFEVFLHQQIFELENVYFEVGLLMGAKIAFHASKKIEELTQK